MPDQHDVDITLTPNASGGYDFSYSDPDQEAAPGETVTFWCNKDFAIVFEQKKSPFKPKVTSISGQANVRTQPYEAKPVSGRVFHKYIVAAWVGGSKPIATDDPQIIVDDDSGGGKNGKKKKAAKKTAKKKAVKK